MLLHTVPVRINNSDQIFKLAVIDQFLLVGPRWPSGKASVSGSSSNPIPLKIRRVWGLLHAKSYAGAKHPPAGAVRKFEEGVPAHPRNLTEVRKYSLRHALERDVNV
ncbi:hypothetical protein AVEN_52442-1 [Araneus ventricosus]|uniref:Uncharacterized protein n=1 Tax=Araneus ventricosus TaxID=182803 RepID=A0A4Y2CXL4_ARAVE|nr:hypothetical protein AVEN_52442-1 [Araneus ventricosus]